MKGGRAQVTGEQERIHNPPPIAAIEKAQLSPRDIVKRPLGVTLLALYCFSKATFWFLVAMILVRPKAPPGATLLRHLTPILSPPGFGLPSRLVGKEADVFGAMLLVPCIGYAVIGFGLWSLRPWALATLLSVSAIMLALLLRYWLVGHWALGDPMLAGTLGETAVDAAILIYGIIYFVSN